MENLISNIMISRKMDKSEISDIIQTNLNISVSKTRTVTDRLSIHILLNKKIPYSLLQPVLGNLSYT